MSKLLDDIFKEIEKRDMSFNKIEKNAGLPRNYLSSLKNKKVTNPRIDKIIRLTNALNINIYDSLELPIPTKNEDTKLNDIPLFIEIINYICESLTKKNNQQEISMNRFIEVAKEVYRFSSKKNKLDKTFADWYINNYINTSN